MALPQGPALPLVPKRLPSSPVKAYSGTSVICPRINFADGYHCDYRGGHVGHLSTPDLVSPYYFLAPGQPPAPSGKLPWPPGGPPHVGLPPWA